MYVHGFIYIDFTEKFQWANKNLDLTLVRDILRSRFDISKRYIEIKIISASVVMVLLTFYHLNHIPILHFSKHLYFVKVV